ncbi:MAG: alginate biosynthesis protein Alg44 [Pseudomonadota bacterium]
MMQPQVVHEAEVHRQHVRLKIPIQVEIDGVRYQVDDWSMGGFGVESVMTSRQPGETFAARLFFPFEDFDMSMRFDARMVYADQEHGRFGCSFLGISQDQSALFRYLVDAYLSGEVVSAGDILQVRGRQNSASARQQPIEQLFPKEETWPAAVRRYSMYAGFALAGIALLVFVALGLQERYLTIQVDNAFVEAPVVQVRAPIPGRLISALQPGDPLVVGSLLGTIYGPDGVSVTLESPCDCEVLQQFGVTGRQYQSGDTLLSLIETDRPLMIRAQLPLDDVERVEVGGRVEIQFPGRSEPVFGQIEAINLKPHLTALDPNGATLPVSRRLAQVLIRPDEALGTRDFGSLVSVRFL